MQRRKASILRTLGRLGFLVDAILELYPRDGSKLLNHYGNLTCRYYSFSIYHLGLQDKIGGIYSVH